tara:strand:+ start:23769 stop:24977 length:1209 start_codon:yes stop_codon:yes gene_type:complete
MTNCCVIGLGYIGLPTSAILADSGHQVTGFDIKEAIVSTINSGKVHIYENDLEELVSRMVKKGNLKASTIMPEADIYIIAVPTPFLPTQGVIPKPNLEYVFQAVRNIAKVIKPGNLVILESTSPVGTTKNILKILIEETGISDYLIAYCPERVLPGKILYELVHNDRIIGGLSMESTIRCRDFYQTFCKANLNLTNAETAELSKLTENAYRDVNIAFANEISMIANDLNINENELISLANKHPRVNILNPGCGVGGHCIAVDPWFIASALPDKTPLIQTARRVNISKSNWVVNRIIIKINEMKKDLNRDPKVICLGMSYKPDIDDFRESPALSIVKNLYELNVNLKVCEPYMTHHKDFNLISVKDIFHESDLLILLVSHSCFKKLDFNNIEILDFCGLTNNY